MYIMIRISKKLLRFQKTSILSKRIVTCEKLSLDLGTKLSIYGFWVGREQRNMKICSKILEKNKLAGTNHKKFQSRSRRDRDHFADPYYIPLWVYYDTYIPMGILLYPYPYGYITIPIPLWVYYYTYTRMGILLSLYFYGYITIPIPLVYTGIPIRLWVYYYTYTPMTILWYLYLYYYAYAPVPTPLGIYSYP
jgi:hypothetical protein